MLRLRLLGTMGLTREAIGVALPASRKTRALLAYLATQSRSVRREHLCELFWEVPDDPKGALRWSLSKIRTMLGKGRSDRLIADRETVRLDCADFEIDWSMMRDVAGADLRMMDGAALLRAAQIRGDFLEGLELPRCEAFQSWLVAMRSDVSQWRRAILREAAGRNFDPETALAISRDLIEIDPSDDEARTLLADLLKKTGRHTEAKKRKMGASQSAAAPAGRSKTQSHVLPAQSIRFCTASDGTSLAYSVLGRGPPLLKAANWLSHLEYDLASPISRHWTAAIVRKRQLIRYDERGNGLSDWDVKDISFDAFVDDLASVADAAGLDRFDLLGISQGSSVSIAYAVRHPERVRRLVLYGGYAAGWRTRAMPGEIERREAMRTLTREGWDQNNPAVRQMFTTLFFPDASHDEAAWFNELQRLTTSPENAERLQSACGDIDVREMLALVRVPTLVLHAREDAVVPFAAGRELATEIPGAEFVALESRNHVVLEQEPAWPRLIDAMNAFLA